MAERWEAFGEDLLRAGPLLAKETTDMQDETDGTPAGWKIAQRAGISALDV
jgi:hypothetical protein